MANCGLSLHLRGLWVNLEEAAVHMAGELKNAAFNLMAEESPNRLMQQDARTSAIGSYVKNLPKLLGFLTGVLAG